MGFWTLRLKKRASTCPSMPDKQLEIIMCKAKNDSAYHEPALRIACSQGRSDILKEMLSNPLVDPSILNNTPIRTASTNGHLEVVQLLLTDPRVDPSAGDSFAERDECIRMAAFNGHTDIVKLLIADPRVNPAADNDFALRMASLKGHEEIVSILLKDRRVNPAAGDVFTTNEPIRVACQMGHFGIVNLLMTHPKTDASSNKNAAIQIAAMRGHADIVQLLMKDERVTKNLCGLTDALKLAEEHGHTQVAQILLRDHRLAAVTSNQTSVVTISASLQASSSVNAIQNPLAVDGRSLSI